MIEADRVVNLYFEYLAEASRRIIKSHHFELIFKPKRSYGRKKKCSLTGFYAERNKLKEYLRKDFFIDCYELQNRQNKDVILCSGLLIVNVNKKSYAGPVMYSKIKKDYETGEFYLSEISINYDILSILTNIDVLDESEESSLELQRLSRIVNELETFLEKLTEENEDLSLENGLDIMHRTENKVLEKIKKLMETNPLLKEKEVNVVENTSYTYESEAKKYIKGNLESSVFHHKGVTYLKAYHIVYLENPIFSAYVSLKKLLRTVDISKSNSSFSKFIRTLLNSNKGETIVYTQYNEELFESSLIKGLNLNNIFKVFPIPLSNNQKTALKNAFAKIISYVQGPPGTGKSHTITAIAILALLTGRKVLIVSAKVPAIEVIKNKLEQIFSFEKEFGFLPYVFFHKDYKRMLINYIDIILNKPPWKAIDDYELSEKQKTSIIINIGRKIDELDRLERTRKYYYNTLHRFKFSSERLMHICNRYSNMYKCDLRQTLKSDAVNGSALNFLKRKLTIYKKLIGHQNIRLLNIYDHKITKTYTIVFPFIKDLINKAEKISVFTDITELYQSSLEANKLNKKIKEIPIEDINQRIRNITEELQEDFKNLLKIVVKQRINIACIKKRHTLENFKKLLKSRKHTRIEKYQDPSKIKEFLDIFPLFISEIRNIGEVLPLEEEIFDLVVVDESSQVNLAEIIPVFYRGKRLCVVGDDKQLSLEAVGLNFSLSKKLDTFMWEKYKPANMDYNEAKERRLTVATSSILDLLIENKLIDSYVMLDEHFRSLPKLIEFNSKEFYDNRLIVMTETPEKKDVECFLEIKVSGKRDSEKVIQEEVDAVVDTIKNLKEGKLEVNNLFLHNRNDLSIGVVSIISKGVYRIKEALEEEGLFNDENEAVKVGTPEDLQGHEFDVVIFPLFLDEGVRNVNHYENERRFNVATSRAKYLTILIRNERLPRMIKRIARYINHFGKAVEYPEENFLCKFDPQACESQLELYVYKFLEDYIKKVYEEKKMKIIICNQYKFGPYRLDFVLYNTANGRYVAVEVDGKHHFEGGDYADWHKERIALLKRAGWNVINTPYYKWFYHGWLEENHPVLKSEVRRIYELCDVYLL